MSVILAEFDDSLGPAALYIRRNVFAKARAKYGEKLHPAIDHLLERELDIYEDTGWAVQLALLFNLS